MHLQVRLKQPQSCSILPIHLPLQIELTLKPVSFENCYGVYTNLLLQSAFLLSIAAIVGYIIGGVALVAIVTFSLFSVIFCATKNASELF